MSVVSNYPKSFSTFEILRNGMWAFTKGFADSLRGAVDLFLLDYRYFHFVNAKCLCCD